jgi:hypothetical protein
MTETFQLGLPLLAASQAQKHVTVNEALARLDGLVQMVLASRSVAVPPPGPAEGQVWAVPAGAVNDWGGQAGRLAIFVNGGWVFVTPGRGWRAFVADESRWIVHDGAGWRDGLVALSPSGAATAFGVAEVDHVIAAGATSEASPGIPANVLVFAVTARVTGAISGTLSAWSLGSDSSDNRYGAGLGLGVGSFARGLLGAPMTFYAPTPLRLTATGGVFAGGTVRLAVHYLEVAVPGL